jgi:ribosomal protein L17
VPGQVKGKVHELVPILVASQANDIVPRLVDDILKSESSKATLAKIEDSRRIADSAAIEAKGRATQAEVAATAAVKELDEIRKGRSDATTSTFESISVKTLYIVGGLNGKDVVGRISSEKVSSLLPGAQREASQDVDDSKLLFDIGQNKYNGGAIVVRGTPKNEGGENAANVLKSTVLGIEIRALDDQMGFYFVDDDGKLLKYGIEWKKPKK